MSRLNILAAVLAATAVGAAGITLGFFRAETAEARRQLERERATSRELVARLRNLAAAAGGGSSGATTRECPAPIECREPREVWVAPEGERLSSVAARDAYLRAHLDERLSRAFDEGLLRDDQRLGALDLLLRIRALRVSGGSERELRDAQEELVDLTGMGVGELLEEMEVSSARSQRPGSAPPIAEGEVRKRFADETARRLGVAETESLERYVDGAWQPAR